MKNFGHCRPRRDKATGEVVSMKAAPSRAATLGTLGHNHGTDKGRRLVVSLCAGDVVEFRPYGTRRVVSAPAVALYEWVLRSRAACATLEKARANKAARATRLAAARQRRAEERLFRKEES